MLRDIAAGKDDSKPARGREERQVDPEVLDVERRLRQALSTKVRLLPKGRGGKVVIEFFSSEELDRLLDILLGDTGGREAAPEAI
jgi:ParB family chromosome partitioning protein